MLRSLPNIKSFVSLSGRRLHLQYLPHLLLQSASLHHFFTSFLLQDSPPRTSKIPSPRPSLPPPPFPIRFQTFFPDPIHAAVISMLTGLSLSLVDPLPHLLHLTLSSSPPPFLFSSSLFFLFYDSSPPLFLL